MIDREMTMREQLEYAADAISLRHLKYDNDYSGDRGIMIVDPYGNHRFLWNPLCDGNEALNLAIELGLSVDTHPFDGEYIHVRRFPDIQITVPWGNDKHAATRKAIVLAAVQVYLGKQDEYQKNFV